MLDKIDKDLLLEAAKKSPYSFALDADTLNKITVYKLALVNKKILPGTALHGLIKEKSTLDISSFIGSLTTLEFINLLLNLKVPNASAERSLRDPANSAYNISELNILARIGTVIYTHVHNDGKQSEFDSYETPVPCIMGFVSAPLFDINDSAPANQEPVNSSSGRNQINSENYIKEMKHRILPVLIKMNDEALMRGKKLSVTIPGFGCVNFAGLYGSTSTVDNALPKQLNFALSNMLKEHKDRLTYIKDIHVDVFKYEDHVGLITEENIGHIGYKFVADATSTNSRAPLELDPSGEDVMLGTIVEGDLLSWMGNGMWTDGMWTGGMWKDGSYMPTKVVDGRQADEGCKTGSSLVLAQISRWIHRALDLGTIESLSYNRESGKYESSVFSWASYANYKDIVSIKKPYASKKTTVFVLKDNNVLEDIRAVMIVDDSRSENVMTKEKLEHITYKLSNYCTRFDDASKIVDKIDEYSDSDNEYPDSDNKGNIFWLRNECKPYLKTLLVDLEAEPENLYDRLISALRYVFGKIDFFDITPKTFGLNWSHFFTPNYTPAGKEIDAFNTQLENS